MNAQQQQQQAQAPPQAVPQLTPEQQAIVTAVTAAFAAAGLGQPPPAPSVRTKPATAKPREYDGGSDYVDFKREVILYITANVRDFPTDEACILFTISYLKSGNAAAWAQNYYNASLVGGMPLFTDTWERFLRKLDEAFDDPNRKHRALGKLWATRQAGRTAEEFFNKFEILRTDANLDTTHNAGVLIEHLKKALDMDVVRGIMQTNPAPVTYADWRAAAIRVDQVMQQIRLLENERRAPRFPQSMPRANPRPAQPFAQAPRPLPQAPFPTNAPRAPPTQPVYRDFQGVAAGTHLGMGVPMDVSINNARRNSACYKCAQVGHFARNCPQGRALIRRVIAAWEPEDRMTFAEELRMMKESDFISNDPDNSNEQFEVRAIPDELEAIISNEDFLAPQM